MCQSINFVHETIIPPIWAFLHSSNLWVELISSASVCQQSSWPGLAYFYRARNYPVITDTVKILSTIIEMVEILKVVITDMVTILSTVVIMVETLKCLIEEQLIFSSGWLCQQSSSNRNLSVVCRPSVSQLSLNLMHGFLFNFGCCFPWAIHSDVFWIFEKKNVFLIFFTNIFHFHLHGTLWEPRFQNATPPSTNRSRKLSNFIWIFSPIHTKLHLGFLKFWKLKF